MDGWVNVERVLYNNRQTIIDTPRDIPVTQGNNKENKKNTATSSRQKNTNKTKHESIIPSSIPTLTVSKDIRRQHFRRMTDACQGKIFAWQKSLDDQNPGTLQKIPAFGQKAKRFAWQTALTTKTRGHYKKSPFLVKAKTPCLTDILDGWNPGDMK